jgi:hypothetical protein
MGHLKVAATAKAQLLQAAVLRFVTFDVFPDHGFVTSHGGNEKPAGPEALANEISFPVP